MASASVTRNPSTQSGSTPWRRIAAEMWGPPPCTITGWMPEKWSMATSSANDARSVSSTMAAPPYLMTTVLPRYWRMNGTASEKMRALAMVAAIRCLTGDGALVSDGHGSTPAIGSPAFSGIPSIRLAHWTA